MIRFTVPGEPKAKARPRMSTRTGQAYTPKETLSYESLVKWCYANTEGLKKLEGEVVARIVAMYPIPKSMTRKNRQLIIEGKLHPTKKPDLDNVAKIILDSLNNIAFHDDSQVVELTIEKHYSDNPRVEVILKEFDVEKKVELEK